MIHHRSQANLRVRAMRRNEVHVCLKTSVPLFQRFGIAFKYGLAFLILHGRNLTRGVPALQYLERRLAPPTGRYRCHWRKKQHDRRYPEQPPEKMHAPETTANVIHDPSPVEFRNVLARLSID